MTPRGDKGSVDVAPASIRDAHYGAVGNPFVYNPGGRNRPAEYTFNNPNGGMQQSTVLHVDVPGGGAGDMFGGSFSLLSSILPLTMLA